MLLMLSLLLVFWKGARKSMVLYLLKRLISHELLLSKALLIAIAVNAIVHPSAFGEKDRRN
jgi:hypothetical protein